MDERDRQFEQLSAYLDGELSPAEAKQLERALQADEPLAAELARLRRLRELLQSLPAERAPDDFVARVLQRAERSRLVAAPTARAKASPFRWARYLATAAVLAVAVGVGALIVRTLQTTTIEEMGAPVVEVAREDVKDLKGAGGAPSDADGTRPRPSVDESAAGHGADQPRKGGTVDRLDAAYASRRYRTSGIVSGGDADVHNWNINTDNLPDTRREVEAALARNGLVLLACDTRMMEIRGEARVRREVSNVYQVNRATPKQVQLLVLVEPSQVPRLKDEVVAIQARQRVSQAPMVAARPARGALAKESAAADRGAVETEAQAPPPALAQPRSARGSNGIAGRAKAMAEPLPAPAGTPVNGNGAVADVGFNQDGIHTGEKARPEAAKAATGPATRPAEGAEVDKKLFRMVNGEAYEFSGRLATSQAAGDKKLDEVSRQIAPGLRPREPGKYKDSMGLRIPEKRPSPEQTLPPALVVGGARGGLGAAAGAETRPAQGISLGTHREPVGRQQVEHRRFRSPVTSQPASQADPLASQQRAARLQALLITLNYRQAEQPARPPRAQASFWSDKLGKPTTTQAARGGQTTSAPAPEPNSPK